MTDRGPSAAAHWLAARAHAVRRTWDGGTGDTPSSPPDPPTYDVTWLNHLRQAGVSLDGSTVLHLNCHTGALLRALASTIGLGVGLDWSSDSVNAATALSMVGRYGNLKYFVWDASHQPADGLFNFLLGRLPGLIVISLEGAGIPAAHEAILRRAATFSVPIVLEHRGDATRRVLELQALTGVCTEVTPLPYDGSPWRRYLCRPGGSPIQLRELRDLTPAGLVSHAERALGSASTVRLLPGSSHSHTLLIDEKRVLKLPRGGRDGVMRLQREAAWATFLRDHGRLPFDMPEVEPLSAPWYGYSYPYVPGEPLSDHPQLARPFARQAKELAESVAEGIAALHAVSLEAALDAGLLPQPVCPFPIQDVDPNFLPRILPSLSAWHDIIAPAASARRRSAERDLVVGHFDLRASHLLVDPETGGLTGVVGLTFAGLQPAWQEFLPFRMTDPVLYQPIPDFAKRIAQTYEAVAGRTIDLDGLDLHATRRRFGEASAMPRGQGGTAAAGNAALEKWRAALRARSSPWAPSDLGGVPAIPGSEPPPPPPKVERSEMEQPFFDTYEAVRKKQYETVSGAESRRSITRFTRTFLAKIFEKHGIRTLLDAGCGDLNVIHGLTDAFDLYIGLDVLPEIVAINRQAWRGVPSHVFATADITSAPLPATDAILCREVFTYLTHADIWRALERFRTSGATWLIASTSPGAPDDDTERGTRRSVDLQAPPFSFPDPLDWMGDGPKTGGRRIAIWRQDDLPRQYVRRKRFD